jgi:2-polyprenyl-3-methyl-5-hydroxy-6-metoxy-1,4-benzoquinol methylase
MGTVRADFDRIAPLSQKGWDHNQQYHRYLLQQLPASCETALDVGCGTGSFSRLLAGRACRVIALDLSLRMIEVAKERSRQYANIQYEVADAAEWAPGGELFDCVASIAMLHHVAAEEMLAKMAGLLKAGGTLAILDLCEPEGLQDVLRGMAAMPVSLVLRVLKTGQLRAPREVRAAWAEHGRDEVYSTVSEVRQFCERVLPGAKVRRHLLWRYSIIWKKPGLRG